MRVRPVALFVAVVVGLTVPSNASTLAQTQLVGVKGANVVTFVSSNLPPELKASETQLKAKVEHMLVAAGLGTSSSMGQYLTIDVTGDDVRSALCPNTIRLAVVVAFSEPVRLLRAPDQILPNNSTLDTWTEAYEDVVPKSDLEAIVAEQVIGAVQLFLDNVESVNRREP
jgi:hypothetical protein